MKRYSLAKGEILDRARSESRVLFRDGSAVAVIDVWRGSPPRYLLCLRSDGPPTTAQILRAVDACRALRISTLYTEAIPLPYAGPYLGAGFERVRTLVMLRLRLRRLSRRIRPVLRAEEPIRPPRGFQLLDPPIPEWLAAIELLDRAAFDDFWHLTAEGLLNASLATSWATFRCARSTTALAGYSLVGIEGRAAYLQRLAVHPVFRRRGLGAALVEDAVRIAATMGAGTIWVNTEEGNRAALRLYAGAGFRREANPWHILKIELASDHGAGTRGATTVEATRDVHSAGSGASVRP